MADEQDKATLTSTPQLARQTHASCVPLIRVRMRVLTLEVVRATPAALRDCMQIVRAGSGCNRN